MKRLKKSLLLLIALVLFGVMESFGLSLSPNGNRINYPSIEKAIIHTDRDIYVAGDYLFFKIYVLDQQTLKPTQKSKIAYISLRNQNNQTVASIRVALLNGTAFGSFYLTDTLKTGYYQLLSFTNCMRNSDESNFYTHELFIANQFDKDLIPLINNFSNIPTVLPVDSSSQGNNKHLIPLSEQSPVLQILTDKINYTNRAKVSMRLKFSDIPVSALSNLSVSVYEQSPEVLSQKSSIDYLKPKEPAKSDAPELKQKGDANQNQECTFLPEIKGPLLQGKVLDVSTGNPMTNTCVFLSTVDTLANLKFVYTDNAGKFCFLLDSYDNGRELNLKVNATDKNAKSTIILEDKFAFNTPFTPVPFQNGLSLKNFILRSQDITRINKVYHTRSFIPDTSVLSRKDKYRVFPYVYSKATHIVKPSDYLALPDFVEISREILPPLRTRKKDGIYVCNLLNYAINEYFEKSPAIFLDGVLIDDINQIITLNSDQINRIECVSTPRIIGNLQFDGIMAVFTRKKEIENTLIRNNTRLLAGSTAIPTLFNSVSYEKSQEAYLPDFRQLLYWNPSVEITGNAEKKLEFFTSDNSGRYIIKVEGITSQGQVVSAQSIINIESSEK